MTVEPSNATVLMPSSSSQVLVKAGSLRIHSGSAPCDEVSD
jgi:hypothetical protein